MNKYSSKHLLAPKDLRWLLVDFDRTICREASGEYYTPGEPMSGVVESLTELRELGYKIMVFTARPSSDTIVIEKYCKDFGIPIDGVFCGKPLGLLIIDDKGFHLTDWKKDLPKIKERLRDE